MITCLICKELTNLDLYVKNGGLCDKCKKKSLSIQKITNKKEQDRAFNKWFKKVE